MIKFYDPSGVSHFGQASITRTTSVNGGLSLTGEVFDGDDVLNGLDYGWWLNFDNEKYVITYKKLSDDTNTIVFDAVQQFFWDFAKVALHSQYTGSHEYAFYLNQLFNGSGYTYQNDATVPAFEKENWGYKNKLSLFNDIMDQVDVEFEVHNETVHIAKQIGSDLTSFVRKGINLSDLTEEIKISDFATYAKGYGAFEDPQDPSKGRLEVEYRSELADKFGVLEMDPIVDERYTIANNLIAELKKKIDATYTVSMTMNIYDLESAGYPNYESPKVGDWILAIDEALNFKRKIRIIKLEEQFDVTGKRIGYTATCGDLSIVDQYTNLQGGLDSKVQRIQESIDSVAASANGKNSNYYGAKEPVNANEGDLWFDQSNSDPDKWTIKQWSNGRWEQITLNPGEISDKVEAAREEAESAVEKAEQLATKYDDTNSLASQAFDRATSAQSEAGSAIAKAESTASEFGNVSQKADSAFDNAMSAQNAASSAVAQASSAAADSKDAKQIAGAVSQSYKTLTDGSTMTIAELESGLAVKLTKADLDGYATETWAQNQIKTTADGINGTMSSIKSTVDSQTTSINDLKADSSGFKAQFTTVNNSLGKHTTDISSLQVSSKELTTGFNTLTTDNTTNKNAISQLKLNSKELSSTMMTVQTQVQNSAVGTNLLQGTRDFSGNYSYLSLNKVTVTNGQGQFQAITGTNPSANDYDIAGFNNLPLEKDTNYTASFWVKTSETIDIRSFLYDSGSNGIYADGATLSQSTTDYTKVVVHFHNGNNNATPNFIPVRINKKDVTVWLYGLKLEKGNLATDWCANPADNATVTAVSTLSKTVDDIKIDMSKKIEQKDLNGYATETWAQNKINTTADGINGTISSIKGTVDSQTTSINELKADSKGFKDQFTTFNDTLGKHTTDIGTLQADSKTLSSNFDSLDSDNKTNQHNIGELQASAKEFNSTLMTVQNNLSSVGAPNLVSATGWATWPDGSGTSSTIVTHPFYTGTQPLYVIYNGSTVENYAYSKRFSLKSNTTYVVSFLGFEDIHVSSTDLLILARKNGETESYTKVYTPVPGIVLSTSGAQHVKNYTFTTDDNIDSGYVRIDNNGYKDGSTGALYFTEVQIEEGSISTPYRRAEADTATVTAVSSISQTIEHIQTTVSGKVDGETYRSDMNELNNQITAKVSQGDIANENILPYSGYWSDLTGWSLMSWGASDKALSLAHHNFYHNAVDATLCINTSQNETAPARSLEFTVLPNTAYTFSFLGFASNNVVGSNVLVLGKSYESTNEYDFIHPLFSGLKMSPSGINKYTATFTTDATETQAYVRIDNGGSNNGQSSGSYFAELKLERGKTATPYTRISSGEIQVTSDNINLKVSKDGVINAVNVSKEGIQIYGNKLHITADTYIDNEIVKNSMIEKLSADKLTAGTIDATNIKVINLNADNITTGTINGSNLSINLNTGNVEFQKGRIHSADNAIDINVNNKYISVADNNNRVFISGGEMQFIEPDKFDTKSSPYFRIHNRGGTMYGGAEMVGRDYVTVSNSANSNDFYATTLGVETFSGLFTGYDRTTNTWRPTKIGGAERGVLISGGSVMSSAWLSEYSPSIVVGYGGTSKLYGGNRILLDGEYVHSPSTYIKTTSSSPNVNVSEDGALVRSTSASKYKTKIVRGHSADYGNKLIQLPTATWIDKASLKRYNDDPSQPAPSLNYGMIAEDLADAGLEQLVVRNNEGELEGIQYDRIAVALLPLLAKWKQIIDNQEKEINKLKKEQ